ncbi:MAG: helix-turn-helix domain-containing protein [Terriglobales bacterium]
MGHCGLGHQRARTEQGPMPMKRTQPLAPKASLGIESLGAKVRRLRLADGTGQERLAIEANVDQSGLSKFERAKDKRALSENALRRIAGALGISFEELIADTTYAP